MERVLCSCHFNWHIFYDFVILEFIITKHSAMWGQKHLFLFIKKTYSLFFYLLNNELNIKHFNKAHSDLRTRICKKKQKTIRFETKGGHISVSNNPNILGVLIFITFVMDMFYVL